jgi:hypothetical protein
LYSSRDIIRLIKSIMNLKEYESKIYKVLPWCMPTGTEVRHRANFSLYVCVTITSIRTHSHVQTFLLMFASSHMFKYFPQCLKYQSPHLFLYPSLISSTRAHIHVHSPLLSLVLELTFMFIPHSYLQYRSSHSCSFPSLISSTRAHIHVHSLLLSPVLELTFMFIPLAYLWY